jgi:hypothetical protein
VRSFIITFAPMKAEEAAEVVVRAEPSSVGHLAETVERAASLLLTGEPAQT